MIKKIVLLIALVLAGTLLPAKQKKESMEDLTRRVFTVARTQAIDMDRDLNGKALPKSTKKQALVTMLPSSWTAGFFPGSLWYIYKYNGEPRMADLARRYTALLEGEAHKARNHDIGFQIECSYGNGLKFTGDTAYTRIVVMAGNALAKRFNPAVGCTKSWNQRKDKDWRYPVIIDNMMNLELLMHAWKLSGIDSLRTIAETHARTTMYNHFRPDATTWHVVDYDPEDGHVRGKCTHQGYSDDSAWARGQAWALYGFTMMARESGEAAFLAQAEKVARMLLKRLPKDGIPFWDFDAPEIPAEHVDASAAAIMASAFVELGRTTADRKLGKQCLKMAETQLRTLASPRYLAIPGENCGFLLMHSVGNRPANSQVDVPLPYADYYFLEALLRWNQIL